MENIKFAITDDHALYRKTLIRFLTYKNDFQLVAEAENGTVLMDHLKTTRPDVILMDIQMPEMDGIQTIREVKSKYPEVKIIALTQYDEHENIIEMSRMGVKSFVSKDLSDELPKAIRIVHHGGVYYPDQVARIVQKSLSSIVDRTKYLRILSPMERKVLKLTCEGYSSTEIGTRLERSHRTVEEYRARLYEKFEVNNKEKLIMMATRLNLLTDEL